MQRARRALAIGLALAAVALAAREGQAAPRARRVHAACERNYQRAQELEQAGDIKKAQRKLRSCAVDECGVFLQAECTASYARLEADEPSVVPLVTDDAGAPVVDVDLTVDGTPLTSELDGHALPLDPGLHELRFAKDGHVFAHAKVVIVQGQRNRRIAVRFQAPAEVARPSARRGQPRRVALLRPARPVGADVALVPAAPSRRPRASGGSGFGTYLLLSTGLAGLGGYATLTYWGRKDNRLLAQCTPDCPVASVEHIRTLYMAADISLGVGALALLGGTWLAWRNHTRYSVEVEPTGSGVVAGLAGAF